MTYNYSRAYLEDRRELVDQLKATWKNGQELIVLYDTRTELNNGKHIIRSCLANMSQFMDDCKTIRNDLVTWTTFESERFVLHVGRARPQGFRGGKAPQHLQTYTSQGNIAKTYDTAGAEFWKESVHDLGSYMRLGERLRQESEKAYPTPALRVHYTGDIEALQGTCEATGYTVTALEQQFYLLTRKK